MNFLTLGANNSGEDSRPVAMETDVSVVTRVEGEGLVSPFIPKLLDYLNQVIGVGVAKGGRGQEARGRSLECEFTILSR